MAIADVIGQIDAEIAKLQQAKALLSSGAVSVPAAPAVKGKRGRPKGSKSAVKAVAVKAPTKTVATKKTRKPLSAEARKRIADAQKARWAKAKKAGQ